MKRSGFVLYSAIIGLGFLWTGSSYISHMYRLQPFFPPSQVDILVLRWHYLCQAAGLIMFSFLLHRYRESVSKRRFFVLLMLLDGAVMSFALMGGTKTVVLVAGLGMNLLHGAVAAAYLTWLSALVPQKQRGRAFGYAYAGGSLCTYLLSLVGEGKMIRSSFGVTTYLLIIGANALVVLAGRDLPKDVKTGQKSYLRQSGTGISNSTATPKSKALILFPTLVLMAVLSVSGSHFQFQAIVDTKVNLELSRSFYAIGLVTAGFVTDKSRKTGALLCFASLLCPFAQVALQGIPSLTAFAWGFAYVILGFYAVYRAIAFVDIPESRPHLLPLASLGLAAGRTGEALGTLFPGHLLEHRVYGTLLVLALLLPLTFLFFWMVQKVYYREPCPNDKDAIFRHFQDKYALTRREEEILRHLTAGYTNSEISGILYISESTVKFHVKNILRKTGCSNRTEITSLLSRSDVFRSPPMP